MHHLSSSQYIELARSKISFRDGGIISTDFVHWPQTDLELTVQPTHFAQLCVDGKQGPSKFNHTAITLTVLGNQSLRHIGVEATTGSSLFRNCAIEHIAGKHTKLTLDNCPQFKEFHPSTRIAELTLPAAQAAKVLAMATPPNILHIGQNETLQKCVGLGDWPDIANYLLALMLATQPITLQLSCYKEISNRGEALLEWAARPLGKNLLSYNQLDTSKLAQYLKGLAVEKIHQTTPQRTK